MPGEKIISVNKKAYHEYFVIESHEAGLELFGTEVKSIRGGSASLKEAYCEIVRGEMFVHGMHVAPYEKGNIFNRDPLRSRKLLLHRQEINQLYAEVKKQGFTLIPLRVYLKNGRVKVEVGLCRGKKLYDKRDDAARRDAKRQIDRSLKERGDR